MLLQNMKYREDGTMHKVTCAVNLVQHGGEFTLCGAAIPDSTLKFDDFERDGDEYDGRLEKVTCTDCLRFINFVKGLK
jgi:hypothetical protein